MNNPMSPFVVPQTLARPSRFKRFVARPAWLVFFACLVLGAAAVTWRAKTHADALRKFTRAEARAHCAALELEFNQALTAAESLGALARQAGGPIPNFQQVATEFLKTRPGLASLELQPGGVVSDIVPLSDHLKSIGFNVLSDPVQRPGATAAIQSRTLTVAGPLRVDNGQWGLIARVPVFQRGRDNRESFWGFVAASLRLPQVISRARFDELATDGFDYMLFATPEGQRKALAFDLHGKRPDRHPVQQIVQAGEIKFYLYIQPSGGWFNTTKLLLEFAGVLLASGLVGLCVNLFESRRAVEMALADANSRASRETTEHKSAMEESRAAKLSVATAQAEVQRLTAVLQQTESKLAETQNRLDATVHDTAQFQEGAEAKLKQAEASAAELQKRVEGETRALAKEQETKRAELDQTHTALEQTRKTLREVEQRLGAAIVAEKKALEAQKQAEAAEQKAVAAEKEAVAAARSQAKQDQATIAELQARLEIAEKRAAEADKTIAAFEPAEPEFTEPAEPEPADYEPAEFETAEREPAEATQQEPTDAIGEEEPVSRNRLKQHKAFIEPVTQEPEAPASIEPAVESSQTTKPLAEIEQPKPVPATSEPQTEPKANGQNGHNGQNANAPKRKKKRRDDQMDLFQPSAPSNAVAAEPEAASNGPESRVATAKPARAKDSEPKPAPSKPLPPAPPLDPAEFRKAVHQIVPLLTDQDPGAKDCLKDNRSTFRSGFSPEAYVEFENLVKKGDFLTALEDLTRAAKKHSIPL